MKKEEILERVEFEAFFRSQIEGFRGSPSGNATGKCPFHEDTHQSFSVDLKRGLWNCKAAGCGAKGDFFEFYGRLVGVPPRDDFRGLLERISNDLGLGSMPQPEVIRIRKKKSKKVAAPTEPLPEWLVEKLCEDITPQLLTALSESRGISEQTLVDFEVGWDAIRHRYTIPIRDGRGQIRNIRLYSMSSQPKILNWYHWACACGATVRKPIRKGTRDEPTYFCPACKKALDESHYKTYGSVRLFPLYRTLQADPKEVIITEGEWDAMLFWDHGIPALTGTGGAGTWRSDWNRALKDRRVAFCLDADEQGKAAARKHAETLLASELPEAVKVVDLPLAGTKDEKDVTDWFRLGRSLEGLIGVIKSAVPLHAEIEVAEPAPAPRPNDPVCEDRPPDLYDAGNMFVDDHPFSTREGEPIVRFWRDTYYRWTRTHYRELQTNDVKAKVTEFMSYAFGGMFRKRGIAGVIRDVMEVVKSRVNIPSFLNAPIFYDLEDQRPRPMKDVVAFQNGILDVKKAIKGNHQLIKHNPKLFNLHSLPFNYDPQATCPLWIDTLEYFWPDPEIREALREFVGLTLVEDVDYQYFLLMFGEGENGKSTFFETVEALLGPDNYSSLDLKQLAQRFGTGMLFGKLANICGDLRDTDEQGEILLKAIVGGDSVQIERKFKEGFPARLPTRFMFAANTMPRFNDRSHGFWRKILPVPCNVRITPEKKDPKWKHRIKASELPGIFNWAIKGLRALRERGRVMEPKPCKDLKEMARENLNPARKFLKDEVKVVPHVKIKCKALYRIYVDWAKENGFRPLNESNFGTEVLRLFDGKSTRTRLRDEGKRTYYYSNLAIREEEEERNY